MASGSTKSFRLKRKDLDADVSSDSKRKNHSFTVSNLFKRHSTSQSDLKGNLNSTFSIPKSNSIHFGNHNKDINNSPNTPTSNSSSNNSNNRMAKSKSVPNDLSLNSKTNRTFTLNGEQLDLSKVPTLPPVQSIKRPNSKVQEFDAVRRKLIGNHKLKHSARKRNSLLFKGTNHEDEDEDEDEEDEDDQEDEDDSINDETIDNSSIDDRNSAEDDDAIEYAKGLKHHPHILSPKVLHPKSNLRLRSSTPNSSRASMTKYNENDDSDNDEGEDDISNHDENNNTEQRTGLFSTLLSTLNLKSLTDLAGNNEAEESRNNDTNSITSSVSTDTNTAKNEALSQVSFVPVKKALITTLGEGNLSLDIFPKNQTQLPIDGDDVNANEDLGRRGSQNIYAPVLPNYDDAAQTSSEEDIHRAQKLDVSRLKNVNRIGSRSNSRSRPSLSPLPRKSTIRNSLNYALTSDEEEANAAQMSHSVSFKQKLLMPLRDKRQSLDSIANALTSHNSNADDLGDLQEKNSKRKDLLFEKLDLKPPTDKRQETFHSLFPGLTSDEIFIEDFACAYRKDILVQGKLYLSEHHICFHSNILGLVTRVVLPLNAILKIQKKKTVGIPNTIEFSNLHNKYIFATFLSRDQTYDVIYKVWRMNMNGDGMDTINLDIDDDEVESVDTVSVMESDYEDGDELHTGNFNNKKENKRKSISDNVDNESSGTSVSDPENMIKDGDIDENDESTSQNQNVFNGIPFEGPRTHPPSSSGYTADSSDIKIIDENINAPMGVVYALLFGDDVSFMRNLLEVQKNFDIGEISKFSNNKRSYQYIKPVNGGPVGPKQTKCIVEESIDHKDFNKSCLVVQMTESPDVPSGNAFKVKTQIYLSWAPANNTNIFIVTSIVWSGKSWIKGAIEKGTISGQKEALGILISEIKKKIASGALASQSPSKNKKKEKDKYHKEKATEAVVETLPQPAVEINQPIPKTFMDLFMDQVDIKFFLIAILFIIIIADKIKIHPKSQGYELYTNDRMLMSESSLWEWIEQRESNVNIHQDAQKDGPILDSLSSSTLPKKKPMKPFAKRARERTSYQDLQDTIEMMEQELSKLKEKVNNDHQLV